MRMRFIIIGLLSLKKSQLCYLGCYKINPKKNFHAPVKDRVCADGLFWLVRCSVNNVVYMYI